MDSSGRFAGIFDFVSSGANGRPDGTSVLSSSVDGGRREVGSNVDGRAWNGTRDRGIIARLFSDSKTQANPPPDGCLWVGRARRAPGCMPLRELPVRERHALPCHSSPLPCAYELRPALLSIPPVSVVPGRLAVSRKRTRSRARAA